MLIVTAKLRKHLQDKFSLKADASDADAREVVTSKIISGELDTKTLAELTVAEASEAETRLETMVAKAMEPFAVQFKAALEALGTRPAAPVEQPDEAAKKAAQLEADRKEIVTKMASLYEISEAELAEKLPASPAAKGYAMAGTSGAGESGSADGETYARVKSVVERFAHTPTAAVRQKGYGGLVVGHDGKLMPDNTPTVVTTGGGDCPVRGLNEPTDRSLAISGAWLKFMAQKAYRARGIAVPILSERDQQLIQYAIHESKFVGPIGYKGNVDTLDDYGTIEWCDGNRLDEISGKSVEFLRKAILDDTLSGGIAAVPIEFDDNFILTPLLQGQLFPLVTVYSVGRRRIEATRFGNFTMNWGTSEGTAIALFDTDGFISAFNTNIHPVTGAVLTGLDFLADSPLNVGSILVGEWGKTFRKEMDDVIADGNGVDRPLGLFQTAGFNAVNSAGGAGAAPDIGDYESLYFSIPKQYRDEGGGRFIYVGTDASYARARGIPVDSSSDARRLFGIENQESYTLFSPPRPYRVTQAPGVTNAMIMGVMINRYRMYRRQGAEVRVIDASTDMHLARTNQQYMQIRGRFGGQFEDGAAMAKITDAMA